MIGDILQPTHLLFILVVALLVLGPKRLPEVGRALGRGLRDFRSAVSGIDPREELMGEPTVDTGPAITPAPTVAAPPAPVTAAPASPTEAPTAAATAPPAATTAPASEPTSPSATATAAPTPPASDSEDHTEHST